MQKLESNSKQLSKHSDSTFSELSRALGLSNTFIMKDFSIERKKDKVDDWKSPAMYTHVCGYKFCIRVDASGSGPGHGNYLNVKVWLMPGKYDSQLKWPANANITIELGNQHGGESISFTWGRQTYTGVERAISPCKY